MQGTPTQTKGAERQQSDSDENGILLTIFTGVMAAATAALVFYSCRLVAVTIELSAATKLAAIANIRSAEAATAALQTYRPFLEAQHDFCKSPLGACVTLRNHGIGPADIISLSIDSELFDPPIEKNVLSAERVPSVYYPAQSFRTTGGLVVAPGTRLGRIYVPFTILPNEESDFETQHRWIGVFGKVRYRSGARKGTYILRFFWWYIAIPPYDGIIVAGPAELNVSEYEPEEIKDTGVSEPE